MSKLSAIKVSSYKEGGCNFCSQHQGDVWLIRSNNENRTLSIRMCNNCIKRLIDQTRKP